MSLQKASKHSKTLKNSFKTPRNKLQCQRPVLSLSGHEPNNTKLQNQTKQQARARWPSNIWISSRPLGHFARNNWLTLSLLILLQWGQTFRTQVLRHWCDHAWARRIQINLAPTHWKIDLLTPLVGDGIRRKSFWERGLYIPPLLKRVQLIWCRRVNWSRRLGE